ncbi:hypothetical protein AMATHDRAFT_59518 [Amanita thiersii Skay4041]|uniref:Deacetylase sirtuin-type domain-containing protein n=1 Tax=Amanita thiersii Skay4041 TaxID=703135 RepID=A0A2A9NU51_9AGAR|nr:hypothetical protein AMATHDRAFT_59518 [Amanita thiersii Skay4041]
MPPGNTLPSSRPPSHLEARDIPSLAKFIKSDGCQKIVVMLGAGVSTSAGIPDFRSPDTGLYANLARLKLPYPEAVFDISYFRRNPKAFYTLAHELQPGKFRPTLTHSFIRLLNERGLLYTCFTQNIDTLERRAGVPEEKIVEAHGSFATHHCIDCNAPYDDDKMMKAVETNIVPKCEKCRGLVKPDIVFFGQSLPPRFFESFGDVRQADLLIIIGTSLTVYPFAALVDLPKSGCPRVLINLERTGSIGSQRDDLVLLGKCDDIVEELCKELGWHEELHRLWDQTRLPSAAEKEAERKSAEDEAETLAEAIRKQMKLEDEDKGEAKGKGEEKGGNGSEVKVDPGLSIDAALRKDIPEPPKADDEVGAEPDKERTKTPKQVGARVESVRGEETGKEGEEANTPIAGRDQSSNKL